MDSPEFITNRVHTHTQRVILKYISAHTHLCLLCPVPRQVTAFVFIGDAG
jgi:hypothetical protein